ncbi:MAG: hypothetical protein Q8N51_18165, partial [Gammaproteobacteria bacterium]|nr:hypothetical protein [Gammaproteobacteria bacterium]
MPGAAGFLAHPETVRDEILLAQIVLSCYRDGRAVESAANLPGVRRERRQQGRNGSRLPQDARRDLPDPVRHALAPMRTVDRLWTPEVYV